jgi:hypothetical protein
MVNDDFVQHTRGKEFRKKVQQITVNVFSILKVIILRGSDAQMELLVCNELYM